MDELILIGKAVTTFGIKGELKVISDFEYLDKAFRIGNIVLINNIEHTITGIRYHKNNCLLQIDNLSNINDVLPFVGYNIYIKKVFLNLGEDEYLDSDIIGSKVICNNLERGMVTEIYRGTNPLIKVKYTKDYYIPYVDYYIDYFDKIKKELYTKNIDSLIL